MKVVMAGASGFLGSAWTDHLRAQGHEVTRLVRHPAQASDESQWDPYVGKVDLQVVESADVVANLAGASLPKVPFSAKYRQTFKDSRVVTTRVLADAIASVGGTPALVAQNGTAGYGDRGDDWITETTPTDADAFLAQVSREWAAATQPAEDAGSRVVILRTSVVLDKKSLTLKVMRVPFLLGLGGPVGQGEQYFPTISVDDWLRAATFLAESVVQRRVQRRSSATETAEGLRQGPGRRAAPARLHPSPCLATQEGPRSGSARGFQLAARQAGPAARGRVHLRAPDRRGTAQRGAALTAATTHVPRRSRMVTMCVLGESLGSGRTPDGPLATGPHHPIGDPHPQQRSRVTQHVESEDLHAHAVHDQAAVDVRAQEPQVPTPGGDAVDIQRSEVGHRP